MLLNVDYGGAVSTWNVVLKVILKPAVPFGGGGPQVMQACEHFTSLLRLRTPMAKTAKACTYALWGVLGADKKSAPVQDLW